MKDLTQIVDSDLPEPINIDKPEIKIEPVKLKYNTINSGIKNILLIDGDVYQNEILYSSVNSNTLAIKYTINSSKKELEELLTNSFTEINRIGFAFNDALINSKQFLDNELFFTPEDLIEIQTTYSSNLQFIIDLIKKFNISNVDYLVCNGLKYDDWVKYFNILNKETGVIVGASDDETGNIKYSGDWVMETTNEDIVNIYWGSGISNYSSNLIASPNVIESIVPDSGFILINLNLKDSWGDGWSDNKFQLKDSTSTVVWEVTLDSGASGTASTYVLPGDYTINMVKGLYPSEVSWTFTYGSSIIEGDSPYTSSSSFNISVENKTISPSSILSNTNSNVVYVNNTIISGNEYKMKNESNSDIISTGTSSSGYVEFIVNLSSLGIYQVSILYSNNVLIQSGLNLTVQINTINQNTTITNSNISEYSWPVTINGGTPENHVKVTFGDDITLDSSFKYFIIGSEYITIDGGNKNVTINGVTNYLGLVQNGTKDSNGYSNVTVQNINVDSNGSTLVSNGGWIGHSYFGRNASANSYINNCQTDATCNSQTDRTTGLICGPNSNRVICNNCSSAGTISGGGIFGSKCTNCQANNCFSSGIINNINNGWGGGGIFASSNGDTNQANNCYSTGNIYTSDSYGSGGICGEACGVIVTNCYSQGIIGFNGGTNCGGIFGESSYGSAINCYSSGIINSGNGIGPSDVSQTNTYIAAGSWSDASAITKLIDTPTYKNGVLVNPMGSVWSDIAPDDDSIPWILSINYVPISTISESTTIFNISPYSWPVTIANGTETNPVVVTFGDNITLNSDDQYFKIESEYVTIDGNNNNVTINGVTSGYPGLVQNGTSSSIGKSNVTVQNINVDSSNNSTLANFGGWIGQQYFGKSSSNVIVDNCSSSGAISGVGAGGIYGDFAGSYGGEANVSNCYSLGDISGNSAGGICGAYAGFSNGTANVSNCYSSGDISGNSAGGICGYGAGEGGTANVSKCYSSGAISGQNAGGIYGSDAGFEGGTANVSNSYSSGAISGAGAGGIFGPNDGTGRTSDSNTYIAAGSWTDASAITNLTGTPTESNPYGVVWTDIGLEPNTPYKLISQLTNIINQNTTITNSDISEYTWPITIYNGTESNPVKVTFGDDITLDASNQYFIIDSSYVTIDGSNNNVTIDGVINYPGLVENGTSDSNGKSNVTVQNINVDSSNNSTLAEFGGWIGQQYFGKGSSNVIVDNCSSSGDIDNWDTGGICGQNAGYNGGTVNVSNSYSSGAISGNNAGGIFGARAGSSSGTVDVSNCYSSGDISGNNAGGICGQNAGNGGEANVSNCYSSGAIDGDSAGGIFGARAGSSSGTVDVSNCYSSGAISGDSAGGICGSSAGENGRANVSNCYSSGDISGNSAGGICGRYAGARSLFGDAGEANVSNCYSSGAISGQSAGGICGAGAGGVFGGTVDVSNCYSSGAISGAGAGGIFGPNDGTGRTSDSNTYIANGSWTDASAITKLTGTPTYDNGIPVNPMGSVWSDIAPYDDSIPWILSINYVPPTPICFPKGTPVSTDQGEIAIEKLNSGKHTIRGKRIVGITKSRPLQKHIVCIEKDALYENVPSRRTKISKEHKVFYKGKMIRSRELVDLCENVNMIPYNREILYNVVLDSHDKMMINNLVCETLDPDNIMAKIINKNRSSKEVNKIYSKLTKIMINNDIKSFNKMKMSL